MFRHVTVTSITILGLLAINVTQAAMATECPVTSMAPSEVEELILAAPGCDEGLKIFESCGMGATSDVFLGKLVVEKCEAVFEGKLSASRRRNYEGAQGACDSTYASETGSVHRSLTAFCRAAAAGHVAREFLNATTPAKK
jgi:hypothetical protein